jgi:hypothetical protein
MFSKGWVGLTLAHNVAYMMRRLAMLATVVASLAPLRASTLQQLSLDDIIQKSTVIVQGTVKPSYSAFHGSVIYTHYQVQVSKTFKGTSHAWIDLAVPGGVADGIQQDFAGVPAFTTGQNYLLFLWTSKSGLTQVIGLSQGLFNVAMNAQGQLIVSRGAATETMVNTAGQVVTDSAIKMPLGQMKKHIQVLLGESGQ